MQRVCFVTFEIAPFTGGGIGTWLRNTLDAYAGRGANLEVLYYGDSPIDAFAFGKRFPGVVLHVVRMDEPEKGLLPQGGPSRLSGIDTISQWRSYVLAMALKRLELETGHFDVIEFTDWGGPAFYAIQEKKLGPSFGKSLLAVRLHSTEGSLRIYEARHWGFENLVIWDLERIALRDADIVVGHLEPVVEANQRLYGFDDAWRSRAHINVPPIVNEIENKFTTAVVGRNTPILFTSKIQSFKRPDLFTRGVSEFAEKNLDYDGDIIFLAFDVDPTLRTRIEGSIPQGLSNRVRFLKLTDQRERERIIAQGVAVFPGVYESFCYAAYEASRAGAIVILNRANPGFGDNTPWVEGDNCLKFDGTAADLTRVLGLLFERSQSGADHGLSPVKTEHAEVPYWETVVAPKLVASVQENKGGSHHLPGVSVVIPHRNQGADLLQTVSRLLTDQPIPLEVIIVDDASDAPDTLHVLETLTTTLVSSTTVSVRIIRRKAVGGYAVALNSMVGQLRHEAVCVLSPGDSIEPGFLRLAAEALFREREVAAVVPAARLVEHAGDSKAVSHFMPLGEPLGVGLFANRASSTVLIARREALQGFGMDEVLPSCWNWDFIMRLLASGSRVLTTAEIGAEIKITNDWAHAWSTETERREVFDAVNRRFAATGSGWRLPLTAIGDGNITALYWYHSNAKSSPSPAARPEMTINAAEEFMQLRNSTSVRIALAIANGVNRATPWLHKPLRRLLRRKLNV